MGPNWPVPGGICYWVHTRLDPHEALNVICSWQLVQHHFRPVQWEWGSESKGESEGVRLKVRRWECEWRRKWESKFRSRYCFHKSFHNNYRAIFLLHPLCACSLVWACKFITLLYFLPQQLQVYYAGIISLMVLEAHFRWKHFITTQILAWDLDTHTMFCIHMIDN